MDFELEHDTCQTWGENGVKEGKKEKWNSEGGEDEEVPSEYALFVIERKCSLGHAPIALKIANLTIHCIVQVRRIGEYECERNGEESAKQVRCDLLRLFGTKTKIFFPQLICNGQISRQKTTCGKVTE
jgi:hypothetical protein